MLQHDILDNLDSVVVAPVVRMPKLLSIERRRPTVQLDDVEHVVLMDRLAAVGRSSIGSVVAEGHDVRDAGSLALDFLSKGF